MNDSANAAGVLCRGCTTSYVLVAVFLGILTFGVTSCTVQGPGSVVGIATGYGLDGPGIESRWGARLFASVQADPGDHPASYTMGPGTFSGTKGGGAW